MKTAVLVVDHKDRDLSGVALVAYWLNKKHGVLPYITHTGNELSCLIKYKPELILLQHIRHRKQKEFLEYAHRQKTCVAVSLAEGFPNTRDNLLAFIGRNEHMKYVNLFFPWGAYIWNLAKKTDLLKHATIEPVGCPRFDFHSPPYSTELGITRNQFCNLLKFDAKKPILLWMTSYKPRPSGDIDEFLEQYQDPDFSGFNLAPFIKEIATGVEQAFRAGTDSVFRLIEEFPHLNFVIKVHPGEPREEYDNIFGHLENVVILQSLNGISLTDILRHADIHLTWRCTTSPEAWLVDVHKKIITIEPREILLTDLDYLTIGNEVVTTYATLKRAVSHYLEGGELRQELIDRRSQFIRDYLFSNDGRSAERTSDLLYQHITSIKPRRTLHNYSVIVKYLPLHRFRKNWVKERRADTHPKYISPTEVHVEMQRLSVLFGESTEYAVEM